MKRMLSCLFLVASLFAYSQKEVLDGKINQPFPSKVIREHKGTTLTSTKDLRAYSGETRKSYVFRISDERSVKDYAWDSLDFSSPDDNVLTIIGAGKKRYKLIFTGPINANWYGLSENVNDNSAALQAAVTAAGTSNTKKVLVSNGIFSILSNVTVPAGVTLEIGTGGLLKGNGRVIGGIISGDLRQQLFDTTLTVYPEACANGMFSMRWYGADGVGDDYAELQKCFDVCTYKNKIKRIWWPNGTYSVSRGLIFDRDDNGDGKRDFATGYVIEGENKAYGGSGEVILFCKNGNSFGINFQRVKGLIVRNIMAIGQNEELASLSITDVMENPNTNWENGNRTNNQSPHVAFAVDGIGTSETARASRFPDFISEYSDASTGGSTDVTFEHCGARYWIVGFGNNLAGSVQNGDKISFNYCWSDHNKYAFANGSSQNRSNKLYQCGIWGKTYIAFDCKTFGDNVGNPQEVEETNIAGYVRYLCNLNTFFSNGMTINNSHFELLRSLGGNFTEESGTLHLNNTFANLTGDILPGDGTALHHPVTIFRGESLTFTNSTLTYYSAGFGPMSISAKYALFDNTKLDNLLINTYGIGQTTYRHCKVGLFPFGDGDKITWTDPRTIANQSPYFITSMEYIPNIGFRNNYGSVTRKKINRTINGQGYGLKDAQMIPVGKIQMSNVLDPDSTDGPLKGMTHAQFVLSPNSNEFKMLQLNDNLLTTGTDEFGRNNVIHQFGSIATKNESSGLIVVKHIPKGTTARAYDLWIFRPHKLIPPFAIGNIKVGEPNITGVVIEANIMQLPPGVTLNSPFFPEGTVLLKYDPGTATITTSNPANANKRGIDIISSDWQGIEYGYANPALVDRLGYKAGDIIYNIRKDLYPEVLYWMCTSSGITNTATPPAFNAFFNHTPPHFSDNATADANGVSFYFNTTSSSHRYKDGSAWKENSSVAIKESQTITSGTSTTIGENLGTIYIDPTATLSKLTLTLPANPDDGKEIRIVLGGRISSGLVVGSINISANSGQGLIQSSVPGKASAGDSFIYLYKAASKKWYRIK